MSKIPKLGDEEIRSRVESLAGWSYVDGKLHREFRFADFVHAFRFMSAMALVSESANHHPEWFNVYRTVVVDLVTHDAGGVSEKDFAWADAANRLAEA